MIEVVINYNPSKDLYMVYEPSTNTLLATSNVTEALVNLSKFLKDSGMTNVDILECDEISYHLDSKTMKAIVKSNVALMKRLSNGPSELMKSSQKFGQEMNKTKPGSGNGKSGSVPSTSFGGKSSSFGSGKFNKSYKKFGRM